MDEHRNCRLQIADCKLQILRQRMDRHELSNRLLKFAARCLMLCASLSRSVAGRWIAGQLMRCSSGAGANYQEACGAESRADFLHKMQIVLKELKESVYWLTLTQEARLIPAQRLHDLAASQHILQVRTYGKKEAANLKMPIARFPKSAIHNLQFAICNSLRM